MVVVSQEVAIPAMVAPASRLLPEVGRSLGMRLVAGSSTKDDVLAIASPRRPASAILEGIAAAANATWEQRPNEWVLVRTKKQAQEDEETDIGVRERGYRRALDQIRLVRDFDKHEAAAVASVAIALGQRQDDASSAEREALGRRLPGARLVKRLLEGLGLRELAKLSPGRVHIFSTHPAGTQRPLSVKGLTGILDLYSREQALYAEAVNAQASSGVAPSTSATPPTEGRDRLRLILDTTHSMSVEVKLQFLGTNGRVKFEVLEWIGQLPDRPEPATPAAGQVLIDELSRRANEGFRKWRDRTVEQMEFFHRPADRDPLAYVHQAALKTWSDQAGKPIFALLPDSAAYGTFAEPLRLPTYQDQIRNHLSIDETASRISLRPIYPAQAAFLRMSRPAVQTVIQEFVQKGFTTLDSAILLAGACQHVDVAGLPDIVLNSRGKIASGAAFAKLVSLAPPSLRDEMRKGTTLGLGDLTRGQREWLDKLITLSREGLGSVQVEPATPPEVDYLAELFATGVPKETKITTRASEERGVNVRGVSAFSRFIPGSELAAYLNANPTAAAQFQYGASAALEIVIEMPPFLTMTAVIRDVRIKASDPWVPFGGLPQSLRDEVSTKLRELGQEPPP